jgi:hypothetical protein
MLQFSNRVFSHIASRTTHLKANCIYGLGINDVVKRHHNVTANLRVHITTTRGCFTGGHIVTLLNDGKAQAYLVLQPHGHFRREQHSGAVDRRRKRHALLRDF